VIPQSEILALRSEIGLRDNVIEKDYALGWLLAGIGQHPSLQKTWVFKGGTCLRKCYFETYRFSEDLDFTIRPGGPEEPGDLVAIFQEIAFGFLVVPVGMVFAITTGVQLWRRAPVGRAVDGRG